MSMLYFRRNGVNYFILSLHPQARDWRCICGTDHGGVTAMIVASLSIECDPADRLSWEMASSHFYFRTLHEGEEWLRGFLPSRTTEGVVK